MATQSTSPTLSLAVVGCGQWGTNLVREFAKLGVLAAVVDEISTRSSDLSQIYSAQSRTWSSVLHDSSITALVLATPATTHADMAIEALKMGKHVFIEKPLALSLHDGNRIAAEARKAGKIVLVGHLFQYHPAFLKLKALLQEGKLGRVRHIYSSRLAWGRIRHDSDALWSLAPHDISMVLSLLGEKAPVAVDAVGSFYSQRRHIADAVTALLRFPNDIDVQISVSWMYPEKERRMVVVGDKASVVFDDQRPWNSKLLLTQHDISWVKDLPEITQGSGQAVCVAEAEPLLEECRHFIECIQTGQDPVTSLHEGLPVLRVLSELSASMVDKKDPSLTLEASNVTHQPEYNNDVHRTAIVGSNVVIGPGTRVWQFSSILQGARLGRDCIIGQNVMIGESVIMGNHCKVQNNVSIFTGVSLEDGVFCGPSCVFTNVLSPRAEVERKAEFLPTTVRRGATIGANATVVCGVELGAYCMIGAGAVVSRSVAPYALVVGNPAKQIGWVSAAGERLGPDLRCPRTFEEYQLHGDRLVSVKPAAPGLLDRPHLSPRVPFTDLQAQRSKISAVLGRRIGNVMAGSNFIAGPEVSELESKLRKYTGASHVVTCASGTDALTLALMALKIRPGDAVLVPAFTFVATVEPVALLGGIPVFVDVEPDCLTLDATLLDAGAEAAQGAGYRVVGVIAVDIFGQPANYNGLLSAAERLGIWVIADAAQSFGASVDGAKVGTLTRITTTSFFPSKPLGCYGDGGAIFTNDKDLAQSIRSLHRHGCGDDKFDSIRVGLNSRLDTLQAAVLLARLDVFSAEMKSRHLAASRYGKLLNDTVVTPLALRGSNSSAWASYTVRCPRRSRDILRKALEDEGIQTKVHYPKPIHTMAAYSTFPVVKGGCPVADQASDEVISLPIHPYLDASTQEWIAEVIRSACV